MTDDMLAGWIAELGAADDAARQQAAQRLTEVGALAVDALIEALHSPDSTIRAAAADVLGDIQDERAAPPLLEVVRSDPSRWVRSRAENALKRFPPGTVTLPGQREPDFPTTPNTLQRLRTQKPNWPTLGRPPAHAPAPQDADPASLDAGQVRALLDQLDLRLAKGEITEATYLQLVERWQARLRELGHDPD